MCKICIYCPKSKRGFLFLIKHEALKMHGKWKYGFILKLGTGWR